MRSFLKYQCTGFLHIQKKICLYYIIEIDSIAFSAKAAQVFVGFFSANYMPLSYTSTATPFPVSDMLASSVLFFACKV